MADSKDIWKELRRPFPAGTVGKLPKGGVMLDYVGHAAVTDRLIEVDPEWTWEPVALNEHGLPAYDQQGGLWIRLTIGGVTRLGYGDGKTPKERIGDAIRNAAMRFGVALDLWSKEELESTLEQPELKNERPAPRPPISNTAPVSTEETMSDAQLKRVMILFRSLGYEEREDRLKYAQWSAKRSLESTKDLTKREAAVLIEQLQADLDVLNAEGEQ